MPGSTNGRIRRWRSQFGKSDAARYAAGLGVSSIPPVFHAAPWLPVVVVAISCVDTGSRLVLRNAWGWLDFSAAWWDERQRRSRAKTDHSTPPVAERPTEAGTGKDSDDLTPRHIAYSQWLYWTHVRGPSTHH